MSRETIEHLNSQILIGFTKWRGNAWHWRADLQTIDPVTGHVGNHYPGPIPIEHVEKRLFDWEAIEAPLYAGKPDGGSSLELVTLPDRKAIMNGKTGDVFGIFRNGYQIHQYKDMLLTKTAQIIDDDLSIGSAGLLRNGARAWVSVEVPESITTKEGVEFRPNLLACTSHDGTLKTTWKRHITLVVCDNTLDMALSESGQSYGQKHTENSLDSINDAREALNIVYQDADDFQAEVAKLCRKRVTEKVWGNFLDVHIPVPEEGAGKTRAENKRDVFEDLWRNDPRVAQWKGTKFGVLQAGNTYRHHLSIVQGGEEFRAERNMENALNGKLASYDAEVLADLEKAFALA